MASSTSRHDASEEEEGGEHTSSNLIDRLGMRILTTAISKEKDAKAADEAGELEIALPLYMSSIDAFMRYLKRERNPGRRTMLREKLVQLMNRAEAVKRVLPSSGEEDEETPAVNRARERGYLASGFVTERPNVTFADVAGLERPKEILIDLILDVFEFGSTKECQAVLLYGAAGVGKSLLAKAAGWGGDSTKLLRTVFEVAVERQPSIVLLDQLNALDGRQHDSEWICRERERIKAEILSQIRRIEFSSVLVIGCSKKPWSLSASIRNRFVRWIHCPLPSARDRAKIMKIIIGTTPCLVTSSEFSGLARQCKGFSGADISIFVRNALMEPVRACQLATHFRRVSFAESGIDDRVDWPQPESGFYWTPCLASSEGAVEMQLAEVGSTELLPPRVKLRDFEKALSTARRSVSREEVSLFHSFMVDFGEGGVAGAEERVFGKEELERLSFLVGIEGSCSIVVIHPSALRLIVLTCML